MSEQSGGGGRADGPRRRPGIGEGIRNGIGLLTAFKDAVEETIQEAMARGDLSPDRAREALGDALARAQETVGEVRERLDVVPRRDFDALRVEVEELRRRLDALEGRGGAPPLTLPSGDARGGEGPLEQRMP